VDWYQSVFTLIDTRSFSNLWFWMVLAVTWSSVSHYILGVPFDMVTRARRSGGEAMADLEAMVAIQTRRRLHLMQASGVWMTLIWAMILSTIAVLGFGYGIELAQALALLGFPAALVFALGFRLALRIERDAPHGEVLARLLTWHRLTIQAIGMAAILMTALWGMWHNISFSVLGR